MAWDGGVIERFNKYIIPDPNSGCHLWGGASHERGYGRFNVKGSIRPAHRVAWEMLHGEIDPGLHLDHLCLTPECVNPAHLELVSPRENTKRMLARRLGSKTHCLFGHLWVAENIYRRPGGFAYCRICHRDQARKGRKNAI